MTKSFTFLCLFFVFVLSNTYAQVDQKVSVPQRKEKLLLFGSGAIIYTGTMIGLNEMWYKDYPKSSLHLFNDNSQWLQMDKAGHIMTSYYVGSVGKKAFDAMGYNRKTSIALGGSVGLLFLTGLEFLDGRSEEWGFSLGDQASNLLGAGLFIGQELLWEEQRIQFKYSYSKTKYPSYNPELLGVSNAERAFKDYNGQTYWASINLWSFMGHPNSSFPKWLNLAFGYGADGMLGGRNNDEFPTLNFDRQRQYYFSFDIDLNKIKTKSKFINVLKTSFGFIKIPAPTLEWNKNSQFTFHYLYF